MMWDLIVYGLTAGGSALLNWWAQANRRRLKGWQDTAAACGLSAVESSSALNLYLTLKAQAGVAGAWIAQGKSGARVGVRVSGPPGFKELKISRELARPGPGPREIEIGDELFDRTFSVAGPVRLACALLDAEARRQLLSVNAEGELVLANEQLWADVPDVQLPRTLTLLLDLGRRFARPMDLEQCLADNALRDPEPGVRLRNLLLLIREPPEDARTLAVFRTACSDASPQIRLRAARELGAEGRDVLVGVAESTEDDDCSAEAVSILGRGLPFERTRAILARALQRRRIQTARACLEALSRSEAAAAVELLAKVVAREKGELATAAALALGMTASSAAEPPLILALHRDVTGLQVAAAKALGRVGSAAAVLPLKEAAERSSGDQDLPRAARQAIAEIQSRLPGASPGQLSLAGAEAGRLSLAQAEAGQLSLASDPAGQLSLPSKEPGQLSLGDDEEKLKPAPGGAA